jgi:hypothetical protein
MLGLAERLDVTGGSHMQSGRQILQELSAVDKAVGVAPVIVTPAEVLGYRLGADDEAGTAVEPRARGDVGPVSCLTGCGAPEHHTRVGRPWLYVPHRPDASASW